MCWRHEGTSGVSSVFMIVLVMWTVWGETCEDLQCQNSNPCQTYIQQDNSTQARCICTGKWAGHRCQHHIRLQPQVVTSSQAQLKVEVVTDEVAVSQGSSAMSLVSATEEKVALNYTLVYWRRSDTMTSLALDSSFLTSGEITCVLLHKRNSRQPVLQSLVPSTRYTICVENGFVDSCVLASFTEASASSIRASSSSEWPPNCVTIYTPRSSPHAIAITKSSTVTIVAAASVFILAFLVIVFIIFLVRRQNVAFRLFLDSACGKLCCTCSSQNDCSSDVSLDRSRLSQCSSQLPRSVFLDENLSPGRRTKKKSFFKRLKPCPKEQNSSTYTSASMLLAPTPSSITHEAFIHSEDSPLGFHLDDDDSVFENSPLEQPTAVAALPILRNKPRHRLSRKRRGYVTYSTRKDKNIRLTTVLETPMGTEDWDLEDDVLCSGHSSI